MPIQISRSYRVFLTLACLLLASFVSVKNLQAQGNPAPTPTPTPVQLPDPTPAQITEKLTFQQILDLGEIEALRARMGGGVGKQLQGVLPGVDPEQQFHDSLKSMVSKQKPTLEALPTPARTSNAPDLGSRQAVWRSSAKELENLAAQLEEVQFYDKADELRKTATLYWLEARKLN